MNLAELLFLLRADLLRLSPTASSGIHWLNLINPRFTPVLIIRLARYCLLTRWVSPLAHFLTWLNVLLFGLECTARCKIGPGLLLPHTNGTVIGASLIGENSTIFQGVTLGATTIDLSFDIEKRPVLGNHVTIGTGAVVLGGVKIGNRATIGANAVVLDSIPDGAVAVGIPAKIVRIANEDIK
jgi:serine O-acetyltransferase